MITPDIRARIWQKIFKSPQLLIVDSIPRPRFSDELRPEEESYGKAFILESVVYNQIEHNKFYVIDEAVYITDAFS